MFPISNFLTLLLLVISVAQLMGIPQRLLKLGIVYDATGAFQNAWLGYTFYANKMNTAGGLLVGMPGNQTMYTIQIVGHSDSNITDPYWITSGSSKLNADGNSFTSGK